MSNNECFHKYTRVQFTCIHIQTGTHMHADTHTHKYIKVHKNLNYAGIHTHAHTHKHTHKRVHLYTHTQTDVQKQRCGVAGHVEGVSFAIAVYSHSITGL